MRNLEAGEGLSLGCLALLPYICEILAEIAVHIAARIAELAEPGEVLVSSTVKDLVVGSRIDFADRSVRALKGVPGEWHRFAVGTVADA